MLKLTVVAAAVGVCLLALPVEAQAEYTITPLFEGSSTATVDRGDAFDLSVLLTSSGSDQHNSIIFMANCSSPGLIYEDYTWHSPYETAPASCFDDSHPSAGELPSVLTAETYDNPDYPGAADVYLSNATEQLFTTGTVVSLTLSVPAGYAGPDTVTIGLREDTVGEGFAIHDGFDQVPTTAGGDFTLHIVPEPATLLLVTMGGAWLVARRRRP